MDYPPLDSREESAPQDVDTLTGEQVRELIMAVRGRGIEQAEAAFDDLASIVKE